MAIGGAYPPLIYSIQYILHIITWKCFFHYCLCQDPWVARALSIFNGAEIWMVNIELIAIFQFELCSCGYGGTRISSINSFFFLFFKRHESVILRNLRLFLPCFFLMRDISFGKYSPEWIRYDSTYCFFPFMNTFQSNTD